MARPSNTARVMDRVLIALAPAVGASTWVFGPLVLAHCAVAVLAGAGCEGACQLARRRRLLPLADRSVAVTALLIALAMPPAAPLWVPAVAVAIAVVLAKELYGGLGRNVFNPAMAGYAAVLAGVGLPAAVFYDGGSSASLGAPWFHWFAGATMLAAFFIATDPVTAPRAAGGQWLFGLTIGVLVFAIRTGGSHPDGVAFAVLLGNLLTPVLDRLNGSRG